VTGGAVNIAVEPMHDALDAQDATGLAELVQRGELAPQELLERSIARIERLDPLINAITLRHFDAARASLATLDRRAPFAGVPFLLEDLAVAMAGTTVTNGSRFFAGLEFDYDGELVPTLPTCRIVILGKAASPELGLTTTTESAQNGAVHNPWDLACVSRRLVGRFGGRGRRRYGAHRPCERRRRIDSNTGFVLRTARPKTHTRPRTVPHPTL
jgi:hypothetical protein